MTQPAAGRASQRRLAAIWEATERLREYPCLYPVGRHPGVRELPCDGGYRAPCRVTPDTGRDETAGDVRVLRARPVPHPHLISTA